MVDLTAEMAQLWASLGPVPRAPGGVGLGRVIQFVAAHCGEGTSTVARELARFAAAHARRPVWLVDLDVPDSPQYAAAAADARLYGPLGQAATASPDGSAFFTVQPPAIGPDGKPWRDARYLVAHPMGGPNLWVTRFRREALRPDQAVHVMPTGSYWSAMRRHAELVVVDAPAAARSQAAFTIAPFVDCTVLVVAAQEGDVAGPAAVRDGLMAAGGHCAGVVFNRARVEPPKFLKALLS
ncbi:MAG: sugar kinase [Caulobacteraceae bacterium]|nr:sugar kinase [Caulobacteraceae bacterium]